ncbi:MAG: hypothetical protein RLN87_13835 [Parasphingopyxis sp.]|uniref:hypothetical protein n=1 Tax=Parasphingopyxis sp. TaxID=1920299 RepID=UPI0032ECE8A8
MAENKSDPMDMLRKAMADLEQRFDEMGRAIFGTDAFAKSTHRATELSTKVQQATSDQMARNLSFLNMPSRADVNAIGERLMGIEAQLARIEETLERLAPAEAKPASGPPRTRKPPAKKAAPQKSKAKKAG